ncbi:LLM class flavin-dependent oxidoreductase [Chelatococcus reniformis]|uniref:Flavin-dependent oxidoreductase n=1 Tax=Chelatococcus reniformis TaxID=1494448 RepID=A0A916XIY1_9HYPH|nr:LLM class flavin-dependent oxidoreductase [Chelatococcus reniformis]GGC76655.1 flavin-dependent oxidoreductase [Chelatococcus reniformis]
MDFGILFTSHPNIDVELYPHRDVHHRVTQQILAADRLGYDYAWIAEHHFSNKYGIMPDIYVYAAYIAALTKRIKLGAAVVALPLANPVRVVENAAFLDVLSNGRFVLGFGSGYRPYEFEGFGVPFDERRDIQEEALPLIYQMFAEKKVKHKGKYFNIDIDGDYEIFPHSIQQPYPPLYLAGATERSIGVAGRMGFGLMLSSLTPTDGLANDVKAYRAALEETPARLRSNPARGEIDVARWVYVAETDAQAKADSEAGLLRHFSHFDGKQTVGYLGVVSQGKRSDDQGSKYDDLLTHTIIHGSPSTVREKIEQLHARTGFTSLMLHYPPYYGADKTLASLTMFAEEVMPKLKGRSKKAA